MNNLDRYLDELAPTNQAVETLGHGISEAETFGLLDRMDERPIRLRLTHDEAQIALAALGVRAPYLRNSPKEREALKRLADRLGRKILERPRSAS